MIHMHLPSPRLMKLQSRLARVPRWVWISFFIGAVIPLVVTALLILITAFVTGAIVVAAVLVASTLLGLAWKLTHRRMNDGRRNCQIVVRNVRVIDP
ncbi:MAG TPA: hypothetical protein VHM90_14825 [Phycisphaerae bacterium]|jgi:hypothetical protein|nr:hypothetical protein [Phycisphaerae bacterium]